jgi:two-component system sensor histidine kinase SenX3
MAGSVDLAAEAGAQTADDARREILEQALRAVRQGIVVVADDDRVEFLNPFGAILVRSGATLREITPHALQSLVRSSRETQAVVEGEFEIGHPARIVTASAAPLDDRRTLLVLDDVTDRRRLDAVRRDFVAAASHELKTPVASILASIEALQLALGRDPEATERFATQAERAARHLASLVSDLLDLSRLEAKPIRDQEVALDELVVQEAAAVKDRADQLGVTLVVEPVAARVVGSRSELALAVRNLVDNALRHTGAGGQVRVTMSESPKTVEVEVVDTGDGIPSRELPRIFERFYRVDSARSRSTGGTGLGLAIVRHVIESHGGKIEVTSTLGEGSTFTLHFPKFVT